MPPKHHKDHIHSHVRCAVLTISDTRTPETDAGGQLISALLAEAGHVVVWQAILPDEVLQIRCQLGEAITTHVAQAVLLTGGTGLSPRDNTYDVVAELLDKRLDGFGELFRMLSYEQIGAAAMLSRALAGAINKTAVFSMPGSPKAVELAMKRLILPELGHIAHLLDPADE